MRSLQPNAWEEHEHLTPPIQLQAQRLLEEAGSPELAKHAVDAAAEQQSQAEDLLNQGGFASWDEMLTFSTSIRFDGEQWWITPFREQAGWMLWSQRGGASPQLFASFEEAHRHLLHQS
jgi:hypothetical protein